MSKESVSRMRLNATKPRQSCDQRKMACSCGAMEPSRPYDLHMTTDARKHYLGLSTWHKMLIHTRGFDAATLPHADQICAHALVKSDVLFFRRRHFRIAKLRSLSQIVIDMCSPLGYSPSLGMYEYSTNVCKNHVDDADHASAGCRGGRYCYVWE